MESWGTILVAAVWIFFIGKACSDKQEQEDRLQRIEAQLERHERILWKQY